MKTSQEKMKEEDNLEKPGLDEGKTLKWILKK